MTTLLRVDRRTGSARVTHHLDRVADDFSWHDNCRRLAGENAPLGLNPEQVDKLCRRVLGLDPAGRNRDVMPP